MRRSESAPNVAPSLVATLWARRAMVWLGLGLAALFAWLTIRQVDLGQVPGLLRQLDPKPLVLAVALFPLSMWVKALQWQRLACTGGSGRARDLFTATGLGMLVNNLAPARLGDVVRLALGARLAGLGPLRATSSILIEKLLDLFSLATIGLALVPVAPLPGPLRGAALLVAGGSVGGLLLLALLAGQRRRIVGRLASAPWTPTRLAERLAAMLDGLEGVQHPRRLALPLALSYLYWALNAATYALVLLAFAEPPSPLMTLAVLVVTNLGMALPSSPGYVGVFDYLCVLTLGGFGIGPAPALAFALILHAYGLVVPSLLGAFLIWREPRARALVWGGRRAPVEQAPALVVS